MQKRFNFWSAIRCKKYIHEYIYLRPVGKLWHTCAPERRVPPKKLDYLYSFLDTSTNTEKALYNCVFWNKPFEKPTPVIPEHRKYKNCSIAHFFPLGCNPSRPADPIGVTFQVKLSLKIEKKENLIDKI